MTATTINGKKPKFFTTPIADSGTKNDIPATGTDETVSQQLGFGNKFSTPRGSGGKSVGRADMNGLFNGVSSLNYYFQYTGRNPWVSGQSYPKGAKVFYDKSDTDKAEYVSTKDDNTDTPGASGVTSWIKLNDLSGTSGGGSTVDCAWSGYSSQIQGLLSNAALIDTVNTRVNSISGCVSTLKIAVSSLQEDVTSLKTSVSSISSKLDNVSAKPIFLNIDDYDQLPTPTGGGWYGTQGTSVESVVTATKDGRFILSNNGWNNAKGRVFISLKNSEAGSYSVVGTWGDSIWNASMAINEDTCQRGTFYLDVQKGQIIKVTMYCKNSVVKENELVFDTCKIFHYK